MSYCNWFSSGISPIYVITVTILKLFLDVWKLLMQLCVIVICNLTHYKLLL